MRTRWKAGKKRNRKRRPPPLCSTLSRYAYLFGGKLGDHLRAVAVTNELLLEPRPPPTFRRGPVVLPSAKNHAYCRAPRSGPSETSPAEIGFSQIDSPTPCLLGGEGELSSSPTKTDVRPGEILRGKKIYVLGSANRTATRRAGVSSGCRPGLDYVIDGHVHVPRGSALGSRLAHGALPRPNFRKQRFGNPKLMQMSKKRRDHRSI